MHLHQALAIYQRIGAPVAGRVQETLQSNALTCPQTLSQRLPSSEEHRPLACSESR